MTSIKIILTEERKKQIKKASIDADKTLSQYVLDMIDPTSRETADDIHFVQTQMIEWLAMDESK